MAAWIPALALGVGSVISGIGKNKQQKQQYNLEKAEFDRSQRARISLLSGILRGMGVDVSDPRIIQAFLTPAQYTGARPQSTLSHIGSALTGLSNYLPTGGGKTGGSAGAGAGSSTRPSSWGLNMGNPAAGSTFDFSSLFGSSLFG